MAKRSKEQIQQLFDDICGEISTSSKSARSLCKARGTTLKVFLEYMKNDESLRNQYARAKEAQMDFMADQIIAISDKRDKDGEPFVGGNHVQRARLMVDTRKWLMSKLAPKKYGDKIDITTDGDKLPGNVIVWGGKELKV